jgi:surface polysaccharide O-acyltransferase-like enzyme
MEEAAFDVAPAPRSCVLRILHIKLRMVINRASCDTGYLNVLRSAACFAVIAFHVFHFICAFSSRFLSEIELYVCTVLRGVWAWNVPVFFMISGVIFLDPQKTLTVHKLFKKYISRLVLALFVFGVPDAFMEIFFNAGYKFKFEQIGTAFSNTFMGKTWDHMWFLYSIIGIYLMLPLFKQFVMNAEKRTLEYVLSILLVFIFIIPAVEILFSFKFGFSIPVNSAGVFYFLLGHYIHKYNVSLKNKTLVCLSLLYAAYSILLPLNPAIAQKLEAASRGGGINNDSGILFCAAKM